MKLGDLFTHTNIDTQPCTHCGAPAVQIEGGPIHFEVADTGARTAWEDCYTVVRGRRKRTGTVAAVAS